MARIFRVWQTSDQRARETPSLLMPPEKEGCSSLKYRKLN